MPIDAVRACKAPRKVVLRGGKWALCAALLIAVLGSCKESTGPHAISIVAVGSKVLHATVGTTVVVTVHVTGSDVGGLPVSFTVQAGGGSVSPATTTTDQAGMASAHWTLGQAAGTSTDGLIAASGNLAALEFSASTVADVPFALKVFTGDGQAGFFSLPVPARPTVTAVDRFGNLSPFSATGVLFSVSTGGGSFSGGCCTASEVVNNNGLAATIVRPNDDWLLSNASPNQTLTATSPGLAPAVISATATAAPLPSNADWTQLGAQLAAIAADAFEQATAGGTQLRVPTFTASYVCCNVLAATGNAFAHSVGVVNVKVQTLTTLNSNGSGSISLTETITGGAAPANVTCLANCDLPFTSTYAVALPSPGLTVSAVLAVANGIVGLGQQLHLTGSVNDYSGAGASPNASSADVTFGYDNFPQQPVVPTGTLGVALSSSPAFSITTANRADLAAYPKLVSASDVGVQMQENYLGPLDTDNHAYPGLFWTWLQCPGPQMTAVGGDMLNLYMLGGVAWPTVSPDYQSVPINFGAPPNLAAGKTLALPASNPLVPFWGELGPSQSGTRTPWNAIYQISYTIRSTGQPATYSLAYSCQ